MGKGQIKSGIALLIYISAALYASSSHALSLAQQPLFLTSGAEPNIMFVLDDSLSMESEITPETNRLVGVFDGTSPTSGFGFLFGKAAGNYGTSYGNAALPGTTYNSTGTTATDQNQNVSGKLLRSRVNRNYYDPSKRYIPWPSSSDPKVLMPNANTSCALHSPFLSSTSANCRSLTTYITTNNSGSSTSERLWRCSSKTSCVSDSNHYYYYPATYYWYSGRLGVDADEWNAANYTLQEIKDFEPTYKFTGHGRGRGRTDCTVDDATGTASCTYAQELQNFANWYTYYRTRELLAKGGIGNAFSKQEDNIRVGFGAINKAAGTVDGGASNGAVISGVRKFTEANKSSFLSTLYNYPTATYTPLRTALHYVGEYYSRTDSKGPWGHNPGSGTEDINTHVACRASYTMLMTDGVWNEGIPSGVGDQDSEDGAEIRSDIPGAVPATYQYKAVAPYRDGISDTLADVAMKFWKKDLRPALDNRVKPAIYKRTDTDPGFVVDPAFWQHMTTFTIGLGVDGTRSPAPDILTTIEKNALWTTTAPISAWTTWPTPALNSPNNVDDLIHTALNGRGDYFSAQEPDEFANRLSRMLKDINDKEKNNSAAAAANSTSLTSGSVVYRASFDSGEWSGKLLAREIRPDGSYGVEHWQASIPAASSRSIFTYTGTTGVEFLWDKLTETQKNLIGSGTSSSAGTYGSERLDWIRGVNNTTAGDAADLRARTTMLGDIVNSSPVFAGRNNMNFDRLPAALGGEKYKAYFEDKKKNRREVIYVGANDGMLHAFDTTMGATDTKKDGEEVFAYIPSTLLGKFKSLASEQYGKVVTNQHKYMVDGQIFISDAYINGNWKNILVGTLGAGGRGIYVLDVTDPNNFKAENVLFELTEANYPKLGNITGTPIIAPGKDNRWKIYLGNGYNSDEVSGSTTADDKGYLAIIDIENEIAKTGGALFLETDDVVGNTLAEPALLPDPKGYIVAAYAGDLRGNLWKYDLSNEDSSKWARAGGATPLFTAINKTGRQPITTSPTLGFNTLLSPARVMVYFGTGRYVEAGDNIPITDANDFQSFYAIADKGTAVNSNRSTLHQKTITGTAIKRTIGGEVTASGENAVDWKTKDGWFLDFPKNERIVVKPQLYYDRLIFPTVIPTDDPCLSGGSSWVMELIAVGNSDLKYSLLGKSANVYENVLILAEPMMLAGTKQRSTSSVSAGATSSVSSSEGQCESGTMINVMTNINDESRDKSGTRPCPLFNRQSWRELEN